MSSFKFPPPPPPPPKATSGNAQPTQSNNRGGFHRGRGDRNERGGRGRGGGSGGSGGNQRGGHNHGGRGRGAQNSRGTGHAGRGSSSGYVPQHAPQSPAQPTVDPNTFAQAMSFMATPAGAQSMAAFANHMATTGGLNGAQNTQTLPTHYAQSPPQTSPLPQAGQKRKWEDRNYGHNKSHTHPKSQQTSSKPPRAKAAVPPAIPSFGFSLPNPSPSPTTKTPRLQAKHEQRKGKVRLGLTDQPRPEQSSEEEDDGDDIDEEATLGAKINGGGYAFEHKGEQISLQTKADIMAWIKDRRQQFPTQQRIIEKAEAAAKKRKNELEFVRKLRGKPSRPEPEKFTGSEPKKEDRKASKQDEKKQEELAALRKKLHESMLKKKAEPPAPVDLGLGYATGTDSDEESSILSESSVVSSSEESSEESDSDDHDSEAAPETASSKVAPAPINVPPPRPVAPERPNTNTERICAKFKRYGRCPFGHSCKFKHPIKEPKRVSLFEKLVEQELAKTDELALEAIKFLGQNGYLG